MLDAKFNWQMIPQQPDEQVKEIQEQCQIPPILANLLVARGLTNAHDAQLFLKPQLQQIQLPNQLHDMEKAVKRIRKAINEGQKITVYGDYDADGMTATSIMFEALETLGANVNYYIPNRFRDGYGPNQKAYQKIIDDGTKLIITVDNGVTGKNEVAFAKENDVDVVITDHHSIPQELPDAEAIVHPQFPGSEYSFGDLSGVGVAFKVAWALLDEFPSEMLDLVAIGEIADLVSMAKENHALVKLGIQQLQQGLRPGIHALLKIAGVDESNLTSQDISFALAPRLNALGRIADGNDGVKLLTTVSENEADQLAHQVDQCNKERQLLVDQIFKEAKVKALAPDNLTRKTLLIVGHGWHQGVLGIVASKIVEATGKPTIIASVNDGELVAKGSGRSVEGYDLFAALDPHRKLMTAFGGHVMACGMSFMITQVPAIAKVLEEAADQQKLDLNQKPKLRVAGRISPNDVTQELYNAIQKLTPFGPDNDEPVFEIDTPEIVKAQQIGNSNQHLKFGINSQGQVIDVLAFNHGEQLHYFDPGAQVKLAVKLSMNNWRGQKQVQLMLTDGESSGTLILDQRAKRLVPSMFTDQADYIVFNDQLRKNIEGNTAGRVLNGSQPVKGTNSNELVIVDVPESIDELVHVLQSNKGVSEVKLYLYNFKNVHHSDLPTRKHFVRLFQTIRQHGQINLNNQMEDLSNYLQISTEQLIFMTKVFLELRFVTIKNGLLNLASNIHKGELKETETYRKYAKRLQVERVLIKSDTRSLNEWIQKNLGSN